MLYSRPFKQTMKAWMVLYDQWLLHSWLQYFYQSWFSVGFFSPLFIRATLGEQNQLVNHFCVYAPKQPKYYMRLPPGYFLFYPSSFISVLLSKQGFRREMWFAFASLFIFFFIFFWGVVCFFISNFKREEKDEKMRRNSTMVQKE